MFSVVATDRKAFRSVTCNWQPPQSCPENFENVGVNQISRNFTPGSLSAFNAFASVNPSIHGAPKISNGRVVPRPSDKSVPSSMTCPGYTVAESSVGRFGDGMTHGSDVSSNHSPRVQFSIGTTVS